MTDAIRIRIGASIDSSVRKSFQDVAETADRASKNVSRSMARGATDASAALQREDRKNRSMLDRSAREADKLYTRTAASAAKAAAAKERAEARAASAAERLASRAAAMKERADARAAESAAKYSARIDRNWARAFSSIGDVAAREFRKVEQAQERASARTLDRFATRAARGVVQAIPHVPLGSMAARTASAVARGAGVDLDIGSSIARNVALADAAVGLSQQERIATGGATAGADHYENLARSTSKALGVAPTDVVDMMRAFTGKTGEFSKLNDVVARLAPMAVASGTAFGDMGNAAGFFYNQVKDLPNALQLTEDGMRAIIGQTAIGSVEMPDFAKQMGRIAANASKFTGDRGHNIAQFSALAQLAIGTGGATSAADAARSIGAFSDTLGKNARINAFEKAGVQLFVDPGKGPGKNTMYRDMFSIIKESIVKSGGNIPMLADMWASTLGRKPITALASAYNNAGQGESGLKAIDAELNKYMSATMTAEAQQRNVADHLASTSGRVQEFQAKWDEIVGKAQQRLLPAMEKLEPAFLELTEKLGSFATWVAENPKQAVGLAITASIARSGIDAALRMGIEELIKRAAIATGIGSAVAGGTTAAGAGGAAAGAVGATGVAGAGTAAGVAGGAAVGGAAALAIGGLGLTAWQSYKLTKDVEHTGGLGDTLKLLTKGPAQPVSGDEYTSFMRQYLSGDSPSRSRAPIPTAPGGDVDGSRQPTGADPRMTETIAQLRSEVARLHGVIAESKNGVQRVEVVNQSALGPRMGQE